MTVSARAIRMICAVRKCAAELDWFVLAADCFHRKYRRQYNPDDRKSKVRCLRSMSARGFSLDEIYHAIDQDQPEFY